MNGQADPPRTPVNTGRFDDSYSVGDPEPENPRTAAALASPLWMATPPRAPSTPALSSSPPSGSEHSGTALRYLSLSPLHLQATVESAPPTPSTGPAKVEGDEPAAISLEEGRKEEEHDEDPADENGGTEQEGPGGVGEPPALVYVEPSPGQLERGVPVTGWLCDPEWLRCRFMDFTLGNAGGS